MNIKCVYYFINSGAEYYYLIIIKTQLEYSDPGILMENAW